MRPINPLGPRPEGQLASQAMALVPIETDRFLLRALVPADALGVFRILGDQQTTANVSFGQPDLDAAAAWVGRRCENERSHGFSMWGAQLREASQLVALCGFFPTETESEVELGYVVHADCWGRGWATELAFAAVGVIRKRGLSVVATIRPSNAASIRVAQKVGLERQGTREDERGELLVFKMVAGAVGE